MNRISAALLVAAAFAAGPAFAQTYTLDKIEINGVHHADPNALRGQLKDQAGARVTTDDILADQDQLEKALEAQHITGAIKTSLRNKKNGHVDVIFDVQDTGVAQPQVTEVAPKLKAQIFTGNKRIPTDDLIAASGLKVGQDLTMDEIVKAQSAIGDVYKKKGYGVTVQASNNQGPDGTVQITWTIKEDKKKRRNTEDPGFRGGDFAQ